MGRNGKAIPVFSRMIKLVNDNVGNVISSEEMLLGNEPSRASETAYLYKLIKLGYVRPANKGFVMCKDTTYEILKPFPPKYNSVTLMEELRIANGLIPENH